MNQRPDPAPSEDEAAAEAPARPAGPPAPVAACTVSRDLEAFDLLIDDMEGVFQDAWGDLDFGEAARYLEQPEATDLEALVVAVGAEDADQMEEIGAVIAAAQRLDVMVVLVARDVGPAALHRLLRLGAETFIPYPLPEGELAAAIDRLRRPAPAVVAQAPGAPARPTGGHSAVVIPVHGLAGGTGATTLAVNLAWELACLDPGDPPRVCLVDLDLQFGAVATYLDLPRREAVYELLTEAAESDAERFMQSLSVHDGRLHVLTAPPEMLPLDLIGPEEIAAVIELARTNFDYVVVDMPSTVTAWTETLLTTAPFYVATLELDMRCAQNAVRLIRALRSEDLPHQKIRFALNRAPGRADLSGRARMRRMAESLDIQLELALPDGGRAVAQAGDEGRPIAQAAPKNPLRREIARLAAQIHDTNVEAAEKAA